MTGRAFVDTNILVYAHDRGAGAKFDQARQLVAELWEDRSGVLSTQVLQEFYINVRRRAARPISRREARSVVEEAARESGADRLLSEDFQHRRRFGHLRVLNPFRS